MSAPRAISQTLSRLTCRSVDVCESIDAANRHCADSRWSVGCSGELGNGYCRCTGVAAGFVVELPKLDRRLTWRSYASAVPHAVKPAFSRATAEVSNARSVHSSCKQWQQLTSASVAVARGCSSKQQQHKLLLLLPDR